MAGATTAAMAVGVLAVDQLTKYLALENLAPGVRVPILGPVLEFMLVRNSGAAFSLGAGVTWLFTLILGIVAIVLLWLAFRRVAVKSWAIVFGLLLGGVLGNLSDRLFRTPGFPEGHVVDFIYTPWMMPAIYNVADIFIVTSMIVVALFVVTGRRLDGTRERAATGEESE